MAITKYDTRTLNLGAIRWTRGFDNLVLFSRTKRVVCKIKDELIHDTAADASFLGSGLKPFALSRRRLPPRNRDTWINQKL
jgi:hypothetical protein